jgi:hypothetical protein
MKVVKLFDTLVDWCEINPGKTLIIVLILIIIFKH